MNRTYSTFKNPNYNFLLNQIVKSSDVNFDDLLNKVDHLQDQSLVQYKNALYKFRGFFTKISDIRFFSGTTLRVTFSDFEYQLLMSIMQKAQLESIPEDNNFGLINFISYLSNGITEKEEVELRYFLVSVLSYQQKYLDLKTLFFKGFKGKITNLSNFLVNYLQKWPHTNQLLQERAGINIEEKINLYVKEFLLPKIIGFLNPEL